MKGNIGSSFRPVPRPPTPSSVLMGCRESRYIVGTRVDATSYAHATAQILEWAKDGRGRMVCCADAHCVMECFDDAAYGAMVNSADLVTADGVPLVWAMRTLGIRTASRVYGPDLTRCLLAATARAGVAVGFYGGGVATMQRLVAAVSRMHPQPALRYAYAPPFRPLTRSEDEAVVAAIRASGVAVLFVGIGCPKQERWMALHRDRIGAVMVGVGAAFDFLAGVKPEAPGFLQHAGLEWLFRLAIEPRRLWRRYLKSVPRFAALFGAQLLLARLGALR